jgi:hypothetical protein
VVSGEHAGISVESAPVLLNLWLDVTGIVGQGHALPGVGTSADAARKSACATQTCGTSALYYIVFSFCLQQIHARMFSVLTDFDRLRVERFKLATEDKLRDVRCPDHHQPPRIRFQGNTLRDISISLSGCCPKVMELANAKIGSTWLGAAASTKAS